jgi:hypothetical protein
MHSAVEKAKARVFMKISWFESYSNIGATVESCLSKIALFTWPAARAASLAAPTGMSVRRKRGGYHAFGPNAVLIIGAILQPALPVATPEKVSIRYGFSLICGSWIVMSLLVL